MEERIERALNCIESEALRALKRSELTGLELWTDRDDRGAFSGSVTFRLRPVPEEALSAATGDPVKPSRRRLLGVGRAR